MRICIPFLRRIFKVKTWFYTDLDTKNSRNIAQSQLPHILSEIALEKHVPRLSRNSTQFEKPLDVKQYIRLRDKGFFTADLMSAEVKIPKISKKVI